MSSVKKITVCSICAALCYVLPLAFHAVALGSVLSPMHLPVFLCGLICGWQYGLICGVVGPLLSSLLTQMPPAAVLPGMLVECAIYGLVTGLMLRFVRTGKVYADLYISMITAMLLGRVVAGFAKGLLFAPGTPLFAWVTTSLVDGIPGIVLQLALLPSLVYALIRARLLPQR